MTFILIIHLKKVAKAIENKKNNNIKRFLILSKLLPDVHVPRFAIDDSEKFGKIIMGSTHLSAIKKNIFYKMNIE